MDYIITGKVFYKGDTITYNSGFTKQEIGITRTGNSAYPNIMFELVGDVTATTTGINTDDLVTATFDVLGKGYLSKDNKQKYYTVLRITGIVAVKESVTDTIEATPIKVEDK